MSKRSLKEIVEKYVLLGGSKEEICVKVGISYPHLAHALAPKSKGYSLKPKTIMKIALACGLNENEALAVAGDGASARKRSA